MKRRRAVRAAALCAVALLALAQAAPSIAQCAMCRATLTQSAEGSSIGGALNRAILVMLGAPYLVVGSFAVGMLRRRIAEGLARRLARARARVRRTRDGSARRAGSQRGRA